MICPFCQHDLDADAMACPRCHASYPRLPEFRVKFRVLLLGGAMAFCCTIMLIGYVLTNLPSGTVASACIMRTAGGDCMASTRTATVSQQTHSFTGPDLKSPATRQLLIMWSQNQQPTQNMPPSIPSK